MQAMRLYKVALATFTALLMYLSAGKQVRADRVGYSEMLSIEAKSDKLLVRHFHDWSDSTREARYLMISTHSDPFRSDNTYAYIECFEQGNNRKRFKLPSPALTYIWISPDSKYIVGLSKIQLWNPYQLVILDSSGTLLFKEHVSPEGACLSQREYDSLIFSNRDLGAVFSERTIRDKDSLYVDYQFMGAPDLLGKPVWSFLYDRTCKSPYSQNFSESVTNWIWWYNEENPDVHVAEENGSLSAISLLDNKGQRIVIPLSRVIR
jgi:hypothetical protein